MKKVKKINMFNYLNKETAYQIGNVYKYLGYEVIYINN